MQPALNSFLGILRSDKKIVVYIPAHEFPNGQESTNCTFTICAGEGDNIHLHASQQ